MAASGGQTIRRAAKPQCCFNLKDVLSASLISFGIIVETGHIDAQLLSDEGA
jgi:hypothetical protein